jgi:hypothetical protein
VAVALSEHAVDVVDEVVELEPEVEVREAVVVGDAVAVDPQVLSDDGHDVGHDEEDAPELDDDGVGVRGLGDGERGCDGRGPVGAGCDREGDVLVIEGEGEVVGGGVLAGGPGGADIEVVVHEADAERLDPGEVAAHGWVALADEVGVDVEAVSERMQKSQSFLLWK